jgi:Asp-tRNA(Asn)/Glu-tRNA(Gln) amidotransferase A subunit family amidase
VESALKDLALLPLARLAELVRDGAVSPTELVELHLDRIRRLNPRLNAFATVDAEGARAAARGIERALGAGSPAGPLCGVPLTIKSSIDVCGLRTEAGSCMRADQVAASDSPLVGRLRRAGAIVLGSTNAPELLMAYETDNLLHGRTNNPWDLERTAGGSSGGEAAAIAAGLSAGGFGSDGGGSVRVPAHFTGICALKPTPGRLPATGHFPPGLGPFALIGVVGPMARTVKDLALLCEAVAGPDQGDAAAAPVAWRPPAPPALRTAVVGYFEDDGVTPVTSETRAAVRAAVAAAERAGFVTRPFRPSGLQRAHDLWWVMFGLAGGFVIRPTVAGNEAAMSPILREFLGFVAEEPALSAGRLMDAWIGRDELRLALAAEMRDVAAFICPTCSIPAFRHGERQWAVEGGTVRYLRRPDVFTYTQWFNLLGNPALTMPAGRSASGLPIGVQVAGRPFEDEFVLAVGAGIERELGDYQAPPMAA